MAVPVNPGLWILLNAAHCLKAGFAFRLLSPSAAEGRSLSQDSRKLVQKITTFPLAPFLLLPKWLRCAQAERSHPPASAACSLTRQID